MRSPMCKRRRQRQPNTQSRSSAPRGSPLTERGAAHARSSRPDTPTPGVCHRGRNSSRGSEKLRPCSRHALERSGLLFLFPRTLAGSSRDAPSGFVVIIIVIIIATGACAWFASVPHGRYLTPILFLTASRGWLRLAFRVQAAQVEDVTIFTGGPDFTVAK